MKEEILYSARLLKDGKTVELAKWDGHDQPVERYWITNRGHGSCDCFGAWRHGNCKHKEILARVESIGLPWCGAFYDYDRAIFYTPEDGEGVPLTGVTDVWGAACEQGKAF